MLKLNLINPQQSDIVFKTFVFPDGQPHIKLDLSNNQSAIDNNQSHTEEVEIVARIANPNDLFMVLLAKEALESIGFERISLFVTYLMAARMDRHMTEGEPFSLRIVAQILNQAHFKSISVFDPHSDVATALLLQSKAVGNEQFVKNCLAHYAQNHPLSHFALISPDGGALKKIYKVAQFVDAPEVVECSKNRDVKTGQLSGFATNIVDFEGKTCFIVDDICDGGGTFVGLAALLKSRNAGQVVLIVSHGIFSKGFDLAHIDAIYCSNSYKDLSDVPSHVFVLPL